MADASVLGADLRDIDTSRSEFRRPPRPFSQSRERATTIRDASTRGTVVTPGATRDPVKAEIYEAWDGRSDDVK
jgi:hypothetical protein